MINHSSCMPHRNVFWSCATLALLLGTAGCAPEAAPSPYDDALDSDTLAEDSHYMAELFMARVTSDTAMHVDLSDDMQYRFVVHRFLAAGKTPENSPRLFEQLEKKRQGLAGGVNQEESEIGTAVSALTAEEVGHALPFNETKNANGTSLIKGSVLLNCKDGCTYAYEDLSFYTTNADGSNHTSLGFAYDEDYAGGVNFSTVALQGNVPSGVIAYQDSMGYSEKNSGSFITYALNKTQTQALLPPATTLSNPAEKYNDPATSTDNDGRIRVCLMRGGYDCDYATVNAAGMGWTSPIAGIGVTKVPPTSPWTAQKVWLASGGFVNGNAYLPLVGQFDSGGCQIEQFLGATAKIFLIDANAGHWGYTCTVEGDGSVANASEILLQKLEQRRMNPEPGDVNTKGYFEFLADFGKDCYGYQARVKLVIKITAKSTCGVKSHEFTVSPIDFKNSCIAEGTRILRKDGTYVAVEDIKAGDQILSSADGTALTVRGVSRGYEAEPVIRMLDDQGHGVLITAKHPVMTAARGLVAADQLRVGEQVRTEHGTSTIASLDREEYGGQVFNLAVGTAQELALVGDTSSKRVMFANGFLVGDSDTQWEIETASSNMSVDPLTTMPPEWHQDYLNYLARR